MFTMDFCNSKIFLWWNSATVKIGYWHVYWHGDRRGQIWHATVLFPRRIMMNTFLTFICCIILLVFVPNTKCMNVDLYAKLDEGLTEYLGLLSPDELELPGIFIINNIRIELGATHFSTIWWSQQQCGSRCWPLKRIA